MISIQKISPVGLGIFIATLFAVIISLTIASFPFLIPSLRETISIPGIDPLEPSINAFPIIISSVIVLSLYGLFLKNKLPIILKKGFNFIFNFEVSRGIAFLVLLVFLGFYILFNVGEIFEVDPWKDFNRVVKDRLENFKMENFLQKPFAPNIVTMFGNLSMDLFGTYRVIPFLSSITLVIFTYFLTLELTKKRFAGLVASSILLSSGIFVLFDTTITYPSFWVLFYVISLYCALKFWPGSPISFLLAIPAKGLIILYMPFSMFFIWRASISKRRKVILLAIFGAMIIGGLFYVSVNESSVFSTHEFNPDEFWTGFSAFSLQLRNDLMLMMFLLPLVVGLYAISRKGISNAESVMVLIFGVLILGPLLPSITEFTNNPYRFLPLIVFFSIGVGTLLSKLPEKNYEKILN